jgi:molecular chaperone GrpE
MKKGKEKPEGTEQDINQPDNLSAEGQVKDENVEKTAESKETTDVINEQGTVNGQVSQPDFEREMNEWKDKYLRLSAEFDNYRKRTLREKADLIKYAGEETLKGLLPVVDDVERAIKNMETSSDAIAIKEGVFLINSKFKDFISQKGLKEIETTNAEFNTDFHEAITKIPVEDKNMSGKIVDVVQKGYMLDEKVVRFAKVVVGE